MASKGRTAEWTLKLKQEVSAEAEKAAKALEELRDVMKRDRSELAELQQQMRALKQAGGVELKGAMQALKEKIDVKRNAMRSTKEEYKQLSARAGELKTKQAQLSAVTGELGKLAGRLPGPLGSVARNMLSVIGKMGTARAVSVALAASFVALSGAIGFALNKLLDYAIASQDARRNDLLHFEALTKQRNLWGLMPGKAADMMAAVDKVSASVSISREQVTQYAGQLYQAGLRSDNLAAALEGTSIKASALGESAGSAFASWAGAVAMTGGSVKRLSDDIKNRFGGVVQKQMQSLEVSQRKMQEGFASLFTNLNIDPYLDALTRLRSMFNQNTASGRALKAMLGDLLGPLLDGATDGLVLIRRFFKQIIIGALELNIAFLTVRNWFRRTFGRAEMPDTLHRVFDAIKPGRLLVYGLAAAFAVMAVSVLAATWPLLLAVAAIWGLLTVGQQLYDLWDEIDWSGLGDAIVDGIVGGLKKAWHAVTDQITELGKDAQFAFSTVFGIQSPSKVFAEMSREIPAGVAVGIKQGAPEAQAAVDDMVTPRLPPGAQAPSATASAPSAGARNTSSTVQLSIAELHVHAKTDDPKSYAAELRRELESVLEGLALQLGAARS